MYREVLQKYAGWLQTYLVERGMGEDPAMIINLVINTIIVGIVVALLDIIVRKIIVRSFRALSVRTTTTYDDYLVQSNFPRYVAHYIPLVIVWYLIPVLYAEFTFIQNIGLQATEVYLVVLSVLVFRSILRTTKNYMERNDSYRDKPLQSYLQVLMIFAWGIGIFLIISLLTDYAIKSIATLGAASAVILLIFKDTILGFVASIQVSVNDIVRIGDWITFSKYGADGYVTEINLATVRVQNFDNTYTTIPTYSLISDSFQNWRGMKEADGRRIKRAIYIKQSSISFLSPEEIENLKKIQIIRPYLEHRQKDVDEYNEKHKANKELLINGKNQTNLGVFRKFIDALLHNNPAINKDMFLMVRHLAPTDKGIPIEIFCFSYDKEWENYEHIQADIFDQVLASIPYFGLEIFELPTGQDFNSSKLK